MCGQITGSTRENKRFLLCFLTDVVEKDKTIGVLCLPPLDLLQVQFELLQDLGVFYRLFFLNYRISIIIK